MRSPEEELAILETSSLKRKLPALDRTLLDFSSNDYLGLSQHPEVISAYQKAVARYGAGATASRLIGGNTEPHEELEHYIANAKKTEAALSFSSGYATAIGTITALLQKGDTVILDKLCHASLIDGARMSGAMLRVFPHNNLQKLESLLASVTQNTQNTRVLVITESIFSMDGDASPLVEITKITKHYNALLMVDDAHGLGILGDTGMGLAEKLGIQEQINFQMGTLGKAAGVAGGYIAASKPWIDLLINKSRSLIYSTAAPPAQLAATKQALQIIRSSEGIELRQQLWKNIAHFTKEVGLSHTPQSAIIPWMVGKSEKALSLSTLLRKKGYFTPAIRYPTVPRNTARLRITLTARHSTKAITAFADTLKTQ